MSTTTTKVHPCRAKGMQQVNFFIAPELKSQVKQYCKEQKITTSRFMLSLISRELNRIDQTT